MGALVLLAIGNGIVTQVKMTKQVEMKIKREWALLRAQTAIDKNSKLSSSTIGFEAGRYNTEGFKNTFLGNSAGSWNTTGYYNTFLGNSADTEYIGNSNS